METKNHKFQFPSPESGIINSFFICIVHRRAPVQFPSPESGIINSFFKPVLGNIANRGVSVP